MESLLIKYKSVNKTGKGKILNELIKITQGNYSTIRRKIHDGRFTYPEKKLISDYYNQSIEELFPEFEDITIN